MPPVKMGASNHGMIAAWDEAKFLTNSTRRTYTKPCVASWSSASTRPWIDREVEKREPFQSFKSEIPPYPNSLLCESKGNKRIESALAGAVSLQVTLSLILRDSS